MPKAGTTAGELFKSLENPDVWPAPKALSLSNAFKPKSSDARVTNLMCDASVTDFGG